MIRTFAWVLSITSGFVVSGVMTHAAQIYNIDFETEDDFVTPLHHGQSVYSTPRPSSVAPFVPFAADTHLEFGRLFKVSSTTSGSDENLGPAIFDSDPDDTPPGRDNDLLVGLGNVLHLQRDESPNTMLDPAHGLMFIHPNDEATPDDAGSIVFDFLVAPVHPISVDLIDVDNRVNINVVLTDHLGLTRSYAVPQNWTTDVTEAPNGYQTLSLETLVNQPAEANATGGDVTATEDAGFNDRHVVRLEVSFFGQRVSGAIDNLAFAIPEPGTLALAASALTLIGWRRRNRLPLP
jgi:hypothetical protein